MNVIARQLLTSTETGAHRVADVRIGLGYTAVQLDDGHVGLAYTFRDQAQPGCNAFDTARPLAGKPAAEVFAKIRSGKDTFRG